MHKAPPDLVRVEVDVTALPDDARLKNDGLSLDEVRWLRNLPAVEESAVKSRTRLIWTIPIGRAANDLPFSPRAVSPSYFRLRNTPCWTDAFSPREPSEKP